MNPTQIKHPRLSEESTTESSTSVSGDSEADRITDEDLGTSPINTTGPWATEEEFMAYIMSVPEIAGRYTDADPAFREDREQVTPPILENYSPRKHDRSQGGAGGYQNHHRQHQGHYGNNRGYGNHGNHYRNNNRQGGHSQQHYRHPRPFSGAEGGSGNSGGGGSGGHQQDRFPDQQRGEGGNRGVKRKTDHSQSFEPESRFYARPIGSNKYPRSSTSNQDNSSTD